MASSRLDRLKKSVDLTWGDSGDFFIKDGDLKDTKLDLYRSFIQRVDTRMSSAKRDWATQPLVGVGLTDFLGKRNTKELGQAISARVQSELLRDDLLRPGEFQVDVVPISATKLMILLVVRPPGSTSTITRFYSYCTSENKVSVRNN